MQHADDLDSAVDGAVEDEVIRESLDAPDTQAGEAGMRRFVPLTHARRAGELLESGSGGVLEAQRGFQAGFLEEVASLAVEIPVGRG